MEEENQREKETEPWLVRAAPHILDGATDEKDLLVLNANICASPETRNSTLWKAHFPLGSKIKAWGISQNVLMWAFGSRPDFLFWEIVDKSG